jgi:pentose-5-phosphate-3-epimerase
MNIYPSILETDITVFNHQITYLSSLFPYLQIDIADGKFVPNKTIQIEQLFESSTNFEAEFHLMVEDYETEIEKLKKLSKYWNIKKVLIHLKALKSRENDLVSSSAWTYGVVLNPEDDVKSNWEHIHTFTTVQIMTINPGFQGNPFLLETLQKINELRDNGYKGEILLDGGLNDKTFPIILRNRNLPDAICPGSYFKQNAEEHLQTLKAMIK